MLTNVATAFAGIVIEALRRTVNGTLVLCLLALCAHMQVGAADTRTAVQPPDLQEGLWEVNGYRQGAKGARSTFSAKLCRNTESDRLSRSWLDSRKGCTFDLSSSGPSEFSARAMCEIDGRRITSTTSVKFTGNKAFHSESHSTFLPSIDGQTHATIVQDQQYVGPCPLGMKPGDRTVLRSTARKDD